MSDLPDPFFHLRILSDDELTDVERAYLAYVKAVEAENAELREFAIWMTGCGYDFTQHGYFIERRDALLQQGERDE